MERETKQQKQIYEVLKTCKSHPTVLELYALVKKRYPKIGQATVYRSIRRWIEQGDAIKIPDRGNGYRYDVTFDHHHFQCLVCGKIEDIFLDNSSIKEIESYLKSKEIVRTAILFQGICDSCKEKYEKKM